MSKFFLISLMAIMLSSCSSISKIELPEIPFINPKEEIKEKTLEQVEDKTPDAQKLYNNAMEFLDNKRYVKAIESFEEIERVYPFDKLSSKAQVMIAYANYKDEEFDDAIDVIDKYLRLNPGSEDAPYMYYLKALCYYDRIADVKRDQMVTKNALIALQELVTRYPNDDYSRDATFKIDLVKDHLAGKEMEIGRFYLNDKKLIAALNRFKKVIDEYQNTSHIKEALYRLTESYLLLGLHEEAQKNAAVLGHNYPDSKWYSYAYDILELEKNTPDAKKDAWWKPKFSFNFGGPDSASKKPLPKQNLADSWLDKIIDGRW